jgi:hypothetical protein
MATDTERSGAGAALPDWLPALAQLASPTLPIGSFSYSQGLEAAAHAGLVHDEHSSMRRSGCWSNRTLPVATTQASRTW